MALTLTTVIPKLSRAAGTHRSAWLPVTGGTTRISLRGLLDLADIQDATLTIHFFAEGSPDGITAASPVLVDGAWRGGGLNRDGTPASPQVNVAPAPMPAFVRASVTLPRTLPIGLDLGLG
jgi:hypothetical protein